MDLKIAVMNKIQTGIRDVREALQGENSLYIQANTIRAIWAIC